MRTAKAFTLIELLVVVMIIAILAAIALPSFINAQTRSKVSRTKSDLRTTSVGAEMYAVDNNQYPASF
ncbi:prepilin-type N-terminal cleavage/methylation domain-containing protein, partial [Candidatus Sumerlaeota bacterium]|nr:prepilin-type N-terminal cleavage/methylation domain-containing protein [Candidatus Sumerlaeota bacterium]